MGYVCDMSSNTWNALKVKPGVVTLTSIAVMLAFVHEDKIFAYAQDRRCKLYEFDCVLMDTWRLFGDHHSFPSLRASTRGAYHEQTNKAYLCNGPALYILDIPQRRYTNPKTTGTVPRVRVDHCCCTSRTTFFLGGGAGRAEFELYALELKRLTWSLVQCSTSYAPPARHLFSMSHINGRIFVMGGYSCWNQLDVFSVSEAKWYNVVSEIAIDPSHRMELGGSGLLGGTRHHAVAHTKDKIIFLGGHGSNFARMKFVEIHPG